MAFRTSGQVLTTNGVVTEHVTLSDGGSVGPGLGKQGRSRGFWPTAYLGTMETSRVRGGTGSVQRRLSDPVEREAAGGLGCWV